MLNATESELKEAFQTQVIDTVDHSVQTDD